MLTPNLDLSAACDNSPVAPTSWGPATHNAVSGLRGSCRYLDRQDLDLEYQVMAGERVGEIHGHLGLGRRHDHTRGLLAGDPHGGLSRQPAGLVGVESELLVSSLTPAITALRGITGSSPVIEP